MALDVNQYRSTVLRLDELSALPAGWDGAEGKPLAPQARRTAEDVFTFARDVLGEGDAAPFIAPTVEGGAEIEWSAPSGAELLLVIPDSGKNLRYVLVPAGSQDREKASTIKHPNQLKTLLRRLGP